MTIEFEMLDNPKVPPTIKPMIKIHDLLVQGWREDKEVQLPKLISKIEKGIKEQIIQMVKIEDHTQYLSIKLVENLNAIRNLIDEPTDDMRQSLIDLLDKSCTALENKYNK
jgi:hypothetical protein